MGVAIAFIVGVLVGGGLVWGFRGKLSQEISKLKEEIKRKV